MIKVDCFKSTTTILVTTLYVNGERGGREGVGGGRGKEKRRQE